MKYFAALVSLSLIVAVSAAERSTVESDRIEFLIHSVEVADAKFIRNGKEYDATAAANHLRLKLKYFCPSVTTAEEFISGCASVSSESQQPYQVRTVRGTTILLSDFLRQRLAEFRP
jgi:hypothetical protein